MLHANIARQHLHELQHSGAFPPKGRLGQLLKRLVEAALTKAAEPVKEQIIGIDVFNRAMDWDPQTDSIVRVEVGRLRDKLEAHYAKQAQPLPVRFEIPKGAYLVNLLVAKNGYPTTRHAIHDGTQANAKPGRQRSRTHNSSETRHWLLHHNFKVDRLTYERGDVTNGAFSPDGESVVFSARWRADPMTIYSHRIGKMYSRPLGLPPGEVRDVSGTGQILFTLGENSTGVLAEADLNGGPWREIIDNVSDAVWLPGDRGIVAARVEGGETHVELPLGSPIEGLSGSHAGVRLSVDPTGQRIAFVDNSQGSVDFCVADRTGRIQRLSTGWRVAGGIHWVSENLLVASGARRGSPALHMIDLEGNEQKFYSTPACWNLHDWTPLGRFLASSVDSRLHVAFRTQSMRTDAHLYSLANSRLVGLTAEGNYAVLMDLLGDAGTRNSPILLVALPTGQPVKIAEGFYPQLAADGKTVLCLERDECEDAVVVTPIPMGVPRRYPVERGARCHSVEFGGADDRFLVNLYKDGGGLESQILNIQSGRLVPVPCSQYVTLVAPGGKIAVVVGGAELRLVNVENGERRRVCALRNGWSAIRWSAGGNELFVFEPGADYATAHITRVNVHTGEQKQVVTLHPADSLGVYMRHWVDITPDGRSYAYTYQQDLSDLFLLS